jgi:hypothetical protein
MKVRILIPGCKVDYVAYRCEKCGTDVPAIRATRGLTLLDAHSSRLAEDIDGIAAVRNETAARSKHAQWIDCGQAVAQ